MPSAAHTTAKIPVGSTSSSTATTVAAASQDPQREMPSIVSNVAADDTVNGGELLSALGDTSTRAAASAAAGGVAANTAAETERRRDCDLVLQAEDAAGVVQVVGVPTTPEGVAAAAELTDVEPAGKGGVAGQAPERCGEEVRAREEVVVVITNSGLGGANGGSSTYGNGYAATAVGVGAGGEVRHHDGVRWSAGRGGAMEEGGVVVAAAAGGDSMATRLERLRTAGFLVGRVRPLAEWVKEGSVDDSDAETISR